MDLDDLQPRKKLPDIVLGEDIGVLSAHELEARIARLEEEIARCRAAIGNRATPPSRRLKIFSKSEISQSWAALNVNTHSGNTPLSATSAAIYQPTRLRFLAVLLALPR